MKNPLIEAGHVESPVLSGPTGSTDSVPPQTQSDLEDGSIVLVEELRGRLAEHDATATRRHSELSTELARQEALWVAKETERHREERLAGAAADYEEAHCSYREAAATAASSLQELHTISCRAAVLFRTAVRDERVKHELRPVLEAAWRRLRILDADLPRPALAEPEDFDFGPHDHRRGVLITGLAVYPDTRRGLAALRSGEESVGSEVPDANERQKQPAEQISDEHDQLESIFHRAQAKRNQDDLGVPDFEDSGLGGQFGYSPTP